MFKIKAANGKNNLCGYLLKNTVSLNGTVSRGICRVENGERFVTDIDLVIFCRTLEVPLSALLSVEDAPSQAEMSDTP